MTFLELFEVPAVEDAVGTAGMEVLAVAGTVVAGTEDCGVGVWFEYKCSGWVLIRTSCGGDGFGFGS